MPRVTKLTYQKNNPGRVSVFIEDKYAFSASDLIIAAAGLRAGDTLSEEEIEKLRHDGEVSKLYDKTLTYVMRYIRTAKQVRDHLRAKGQESTVIEAIVSRLQEYKYIDDEAFARAYVHDGLKLKGKGKQRLVGELRMKGVAADVIDSVLLEVPEEDEINGLRKLAQKKLAQEKYQDQRRLMSYLASKGYNYDDIKKIIDELSAS